MEERVLKFKAWSLDKKQFIELTGFEFNSDGTLSGVFLDGDFVKINRVILCQFTGCVDKRGREIYEYDIVAASWGYIGVVMYDSFMHAKKENTISDDIEVVKSSLEVVG